MKKILSALITLLGITAILACKNKSSLHCGMDDKSFPTAINNKSFLWEISGNGLQKPSYFLGTMHLMCAEDAELSANVKALIKATEQVYLEVDMDNAGELLTGLIDLSANKGHNLADTLGAKNYEKVKSFFERFQPDVPFSVLERQPPLMISSSLYELLLPCEKKNGVEMKIIDEAYKARKETKGLETITFQASIFDTIPYKAQAEDLVKIIDSLDKYRTTMEEMVKLYKEQDIEKLYSAGLQDDSSISNYMDLLLFNRNRNWVKQFPSIAKNTSTLFAVGAGHLGGDKGVLHLLQQQGYTVRPLVN